MPSFRNISMAEENKDSSVVRVPSIVTFDDVQNTFNKYGIKFEGETVENTKLCGVIIHLENEIKALKLN